MLKKIFLAALLFCSSYIAAADYFDDFVALYDKFGNDKYMIEEDITQRAQVLQAAYIAQLAGAPEDIIIGLLFHDIGQLVEQDHVGDTAYLRQHNHDSLKIFLIT